MGVVMTKTCLYCLSEVQESAVKCRFCGEWLRGNGENGQKVLREFSVTSPLIRRAERNAESVRFVWKAILVVCVAGLAPLVSMAGNGHDIALVVTIAIGCMLVLLGILAIVLLSSVSAIVELLAAILRNQVDTRNRTNGKLHSVEQMVHE